MNKHLIFYAHWLSKKSINSFPHFLQRNTFSHQIRSSIWCSLVIFLSITPLHSQAQWLDRLYINGSLGYNRHSDAGVYIHFKKHFSAGFSASRFTLKTGPVYNNGSLINASEQKKNTYLSQQLYAGITTRYLRKFDISFLIGIERVDATLLSDFVVNYNENSHSESVQYDSNRKQTIGASMRFEALFEIHKNWGINFCIQQQLNLIQSEFSFVLGLNIGLVQDRSKFKHSS